MGDGGEYFTSSWQPVLWNNGRTCGRRVSLLCSSGGLVSHVLHSGPTPGRTWHSRLGLTAVSVRGKTRRISGVPRIDTDSNLVSTTH